MVSQWAMVGLACAAIISLLAPVITYLVCRGRMTLPGRNIAIGAGVFVLFALVLESAMHWYVLLHNPVTSAWLRAHAWGYIVYAAGAAALYEETGRYVAMRLLVKPAGEPGTAVSYGLGHGGFESMLVGALGQLQALILSLLLNIGLLDPLLAGRLQHDAVVKIHAALTKVDFPLALMGGFERIWALMIQIGCSLMVWRAVARRDVRWFAAALAAHFSIDSVAAATQRGLVSVETTEAIVTAIGAALLLFYLIKLPRRAVVA